MSTHRLLVTDRLDLDHACTEPCEVEEYVDANETRLLANYPTGSHPVDLVHERDADDEPYTALLPLWEPDEFYPLPGETPTVAGPLRGFPYLWRTA